jgi:hypothetical protein
MYTVMCARAVLRLSGRRSHIVFAPDALLPSHAHDNTIVPRTPGTWTLSRHVFADKITKLVTTIRKTSKTGRKLFIDWTLLHACTYLYYIIRTAHTSYNVVLYYYYYIYTLRCTAIHVYIYTIHIFIYIYIMDTTCTRPRCVYRRIAVKLHAKWWFFSAGRTRAHTYIVLLYLNYYYYIYMPVCVCALHISLHSLSSRCVIT